MCDGLLLAYSTKLWREKTLADLELQENWWEKILVAGHTNNSSLFELTTFGG